MYTSVRMDPVQCQDVNTYCDGFKRMMCINGYWTDTGFSKECMIIESPKPVLIEGIVGGYIAGQVGNEMAAINTLVETTPPQTLTPYLVAGALAAIVGGVMFVALKRKR